MTKFSEGLLEYMAVTGSMRAALNNASGTPAGCFMYWYSGTEPDSADDAVTGDILLAFTEGPLPSSTGLTFGATAGVSGNNVTISKTGAESWDAIGTAAAGAGVAPTFYRICLESDDGTGAASSGEIRIQGSIGPAVTEGIVYNGLIVEDSEYNLASFTIAQPTGES